MNINVVVKGCHRSSCVHDKCSYGPTNQITLKRRNVNEGLLKSSRNILQETHLTSFVLSILEAKLIESTMEEATTMRKVFQMTRILA